MLIPEGENGGRVLLDVDFSLLALTVIVVAGRVFSRFKMQGKLRSDDVFILLSTLLFIALVVLHSVMVFDYHLGKSTATLAQTDIRTQALIGGIARILYLPATALIRVSVLLLTRRLSPYCWVRHSTTVLTICNVVFAILMVFLIIFTCNPVSASFQPPPMRRKAQCLNYYTIQRVVPAGSAVLDFLVWVLPVVLVVRVQFLGWKKKTIAVGLLGMGVIACIAGVMRVVILFRTPGGRDPSRRAPVLGLWTSAEIAMGIVAASAPALWPLVIMVVRAFTEKTPSFRFWNRPASSADEEIAAQPMRQEQQGVPMDTITVWNLTVEEDVTIPHGIRNYKSQEPLFAEDRQNQ